MKKITMVEVNRVIDFPPVLNAIRILLDMGHCVTLISRDVHLLPNEITSNAKFRSLEIPWLPENGIVGKIKHRYALNRFVRETVKKCMLDSDLLWTTSIVTIRELRKDVYKYKHIFQLMELTRYGFLTKLQIKYPLDTIARKAYKVVMPEINRAYISKVWWNLDTLPMVLPNKPYSIDAGNLTDDVSHALNIIKNEKRKVILYLGGIFSDRNLETIASAIKNSNEYVLYIVGKTFSDEGNRILKNLVENYPVVYLGGYNPPAHLHFLKYTYLGVLPYKPVKTQSSDELNALYCAPNKIYEYAGYGIPMIGSNVLGLRFPFEKWNIGYCYDDNSAESVIRAIGYVSEKYDLMSKNCLDFYNDTDLNQIISDIIGE